MKKQLKAIRKIDPKAAEYIEKEVLPKYSKERIKELTKKKGSILPWKNKAKFELMDLIGFWELTPQGRDYWFKIWKELNDDSSNNL